jgi:hypothetical protein
MLLCSSIQIVSAQDEYVYSIQWKIGLPSGVAVDSADNVYVTDSENQVLKFTSTGVFITKLGSDSPKQSGPSNKVVSSGDGQVNDPWGIAVDSAGNVYVADSMNHRVQKFSSTGVFITKWGSKGTGDGQFSWPHHVAVDSADNVYVTDFTQVQKFSSTGVFITKWGDELFSYPEGIAVDSADNVYVADSNDNRITKFTSTGTFITKWGSQGTGEGEFSSPKGIAVDGADNVYVADDYNDRIQKFTSSGVFITEWGRKGVQTGGFDYPQDVAVDSIGNVYVADEMNQRIQKFTPPSATTEIPTPGSTPVEMTQLIGMIRVLEMLRSLFIGAVVIVVISLVAIRLHR